MDEASSRPGLRVQVREVQPGTPGFEPVLAGNIKGFLDRSANPTTIVPEADKRNLTPDSFQEALTRDVPSRNEARAGCERS